jgi:ketosteroid isomerase-like protein
VHPVRDDTTQRNKQLVLDFLAHGYAHRTAEAMALLHPQASWWVLGDPQRLKVAGLRQGPQIQRLLEGVKRGIPGGMRFVVHGFAAEGDRVAAEVEADGHLANGKRYHNRYHFLFEIRDDLVFAVREYMDTLHAHDVTQP